MRAYLGRAFAVVALGSAFAMPALAVGDFTQQQPIEVRVDLGTKKGEHVFVPNYLELETGKLYKLVLYNPDKGPHYFTSFGLANRVFTRKVQVMSGAGVGSKPISEVKGAIREIEVYPGGTTEWWFVPVQAGKIDDLQCTIKHKDGTTHAQHGMVGIVDIK
jgi:uncharacterized cupredoxin-like copper-binding protein